MSSAIRADGATEVRETYERMVRDRQQAGREIPAAPIYLDTLRKEDRDTARMSVEASQDIMQRAQRRSYTVDFSMADLKARRAARMAQASVSLLVACSLLGITKTSVRRLGKAGRIETIIVDGETRYLRASVDLYLATSSRRKHRYVEED